jgi:uncharacterized metal-binding protein
MSNGITKAGIISCSGEAIPEGTIARMATRQVLETLRPGKAVTICLPLFLAGEEGERNFAKTHPTITVDGCEKQCSRSLRFASPVDQQAVSAVAERIAAEIDRVLSNTTA